MLVLVVAVPERHVAPAAGTLIGRRRSIADSAIGGIAETQEMLDFCAEHGITADIELIPVQQVDDAYTRMLASAVKYRFVIRSEEHTSELQSIISNSYALFCLKEQTT